MTTTETTPLAAGVPGRELSLTTLLRQVDQWVWLRMGVHANLRGWLVGFDHAQHRLPGRPGQRLTVKLAADDTYSVEVGRLRKLDYKVLGQRHGVTVDQLAATLDDLYQSV
jgi:hypothetical protein